MTLKMRPGLPPFLRDENGHIPMTDETADWLVVVTREALEGIAQPPNGSLERLLQFVDTFGAVATFKLEHGAGAEETIWVQQEDVAEYQANSTSRYPLPQARSDRHLRRTSAVGIPYSLDFGLSRGIIVPGRG